MDMNGYTISDILTPNAIETLHKIGDEFPDKTFDVAIALDRLIKHINLEIATEKEKSIWDKGKINEYMQNSNMLSVLFDFLLDSTNKELVSIKGNRLGTYQEYTLNDIWVHKRFVKIKICDTQIDVDGSVDMLKRTCEYLVSRNINIFYDIIETQCICGRTSPYFSTNIKSLRRGIELSNANDIYIETNHPADRIKNIIIGLLQVYEIPLTEFKSYTFNELQQNKVTPMQVRKKMKFMK